MAERKDHVGIFSFAKQDSDEGDENAITIPENIDDRVEHPDDVLDELETRLTESFQGLDESGSLDAETIGAMNELAEGIDIVRAERTRRQEADAAAEAEKEALRNRITAQSEGGDGEGDGGENGEGGEDGGDEVTAETVEPQPEPETQPAPEPVAVAAAGNRVPATPKARRINVPLSEVRRRAPAVEVPRASTIRASADVPGFHAGAPLNSITDLAKAIAERSRTTPITQAGTISGPKVASIIRDFTHKVSIDSSSDHVDRVLKEITDQNALVAAGGWCAPSEILYDFFNIADEDGILDLPTMGIARGGVRFPHSISIADVFSNVFLWTETDDIATVTGTPNKPCFRAPCPSFTEERLECHGVCVTAGNLTEEAYPELIANHLALTMSAHVHVMNMRHIADLVAQSVAVNAVEDTPNSSTTSGVLGATELQVWDYRNKFAMSDSAVLEAVYPSWIKGQMRSDLSKRTGVDLLAVTDADLMRWFDLRGVRAQFVQDWQVRSAGLPGQATPATDWPTSVSFLVYAAGTFVLGQGMVLDLGVTRDSVLNAENDHTAAWTEDCRLVAKIGHESRVVTIDTDNAGETGAANITGAGV